MEVHIDLKMYKQRLHLQYSFFLLKLVRVIFHLADILSLFTATLFGILPLFSRCSFIKKVLIILLSDTFYY